MIVMKRIMMMVMIVMTMIMRMMMILMRRIVKMVMMAMMNENENVVDAKGKFLLENFRLDPNAPLR